ncbi:MAG: YigZ family protein [Candidatus Sericytochromatia bacterium]
MTAYRTLAGSGESEIVILNSRFIASGAEARSVEEAEAFLKQVQRKYPDASHHCYAFKVLGPPVVDRFSDAGEPNGTAGRPILTVIEHHLNNAVIVVTRYFGGTKLGKGGLVKAYTQAAKALIEALGTAERENTITLGLDYPYALANPIEHWCRQQQLEPELAYGETVRARLQVPESRLPAVTAALADWEHQGLRWQEE